MSIGIIDRTCRLNRREMRAMQVVAIVLEALDKSMPELRDHFGGRRVGSFSDELMRAFMDRGIEVLSDWHRSQLQLPARGPDGWTIPEIVAYEQLLTDMMVRPSVMIMPKLSPEEEKEVEANWRNNPGHIIWVQPADRSEIKPEPPKE